MKANTTLKGMTWSHPRGYDPLIRCSDIWRELRGVAVEWDKRSLQDFESFPVEELARTYDLIIIDHPHVGQITSQSCLTPLDDPHRLTECGVLEDGSIGQSFRSYNWQGRQWALPVDAAAQVQAWRPDKMAAPLKSWPEVLRLAATRRVMLPLLPPHSLMVFMSLCANLGRPCSVETGDLIDPVTGARVFEMMAALNRFLDPSCYDMDPIAVLEALSQTDPDCFCSPLIYGYVSYAQEGFRPARLAFADFPAAGGSGPIGSVLGGTGIAVSSRTSHRKEAVDFAYWISSADVQRGPYAAAGGQPGHAAAWSDDGVNRPVLDFYKATRATLDGAWVRPRFDGYMAFQHQASERIVFGLKGNEPAQEVVKDLTRLFGESA